DLVRLEADDKLVGADIAGALVEDRMRDALEFYDNLRNPARHPLAGTQVEGHPGPAPVGNLRLDGDEGLGAGFATQFLDIALHRSACRSAGAILASHCLA